MESEHTFSAHGREENQTFAVAFAICLACHILIFVALVFMPNLSPARKINLTAIPVRMVSLPSDLPAGGPPPQPEAPPEPPQPPPPEPEPVPEPEPEKAVEVPPEPAEPKKITPKVAKPEVVPEPEPDAVSLAPKKPVKKKNSLKEKTYDQAQVKKIKQKAKEQAEDQKTAQQKAQALARIKQDAAKAPPRPPAGNGLGAGGGSGGVDPGTLKLIELYSLEVQSIIAQNWAFSGQLARLNRDVKAVIIVKIARNGNIARVMWETKSGNRFLDESAEKAIRKSDPLPPLPPSWNRPYFDLAVGFTPQGLSG
jgi:colicin import membrane protein